MTETSTPALYYVTKLIIAVKGLRGLPVAWIIKCFIAIFAAVL
jgi:hypothetical protein